MDANCDTHPGDAEAAGAVAGMQETYGRPLPAPGDWVSGSFFGRTFSGSVRHADPAGVIVEVCPEYGSTITVRPCDLEW